MNKIKLAIVGIGNRSNTYVLNSPLTKPGWNGIYGVFHPARRCRQPDIPHPRHNDEPGKYVVCLGLL
ncbi:MAG: hypothetical protein ABW072_04685 [Sedimenticola sp.]